MVTVLEIKYKNTLDDYVNFYWFSQKPLILIIFYGFQALFLFGIVYALTDYDYSLSARIIAVAIIIILWIIYRVFCKKVNKKTIAQGVIKIRAKMDSSLLSEKTLIINEDNITIKSVRGTKKFSFKIISRIHEEDNCIYIINIIRDVTAIIPTNIFTSTEEKEQVIAQLKTRCKRK